MKTPHPVVAVINQKGGVAKTTTALALAACLADDGNTTLVIDADPQGSLSYSAGVAPAVGADTAALLGGADVWTCVTNWLPATDACAGADLCGATSELAAVAGELPVPPHRAGGFCRVLREVRVHYDVTIVDCGPTLGALTVGVLSGATHVLIPVTCDILAHRGVGQLLDTVADVSEFINPELQVLGLIPTMFDARLTHSRVILDDLTHRFAIPVFGPIPRSVRCAEAPLAGRSVVHTAPRSPAAIAYRALARDIVHRM